jgi:hypothetical protein
MFRDWILRGFYCFYEKFEGKLEIVGFFLGKGKFRIV